MPVVTIRGQLGSGAPDIGREVARIIQGDYVDREIIESIAQLVGHPKDQVAEKERISPRLVQRVMAALARALKRSGSIESAYSRTWQEPLDDTKYLDALESVIQALALEGNIVIRGRGSQFILHNNPSALHVLVIAPLRDRIKRVMATSAIDEDAARMQIEEFDNNRRAFIQRFFKCELENPDYYDLIVNTEHLRYEVAARIIATTAQQKTPWGYG
jgi:cytidylate kinase